MMVMMLSTISRSSSILKLEKISIATMAVLYVLFLRILIPSNRLTSDGHIGTSTYFGQGR